MLATDSNFGFFFRSLPKLQRSEDERTALSVWPMPPPYPRWLLPNEGDVEKLPYPIIARQKAVNLAVITLSWLHLLRPRIAPQEMRVGRALSSKQRLVVSKLEMYYREVSFDGDIGPAEMGRTAAKLESLDTLLTSLQDQASRLHAGDYRTKMRLDELPRKEPLRVGRREGDLGEVVGSMSTAMPVQAKELVASRIAIPSRPPEFDPRPLLHEPHHTVYVDPVSLAKPVNEASQPPRVRVHAGRKEAVAFVEKLDQHHRLRLAEKDEVRASHLCGAFALTKDADLDRLILDARPPNDLEPTLTDWVRTLGAVQSLLQIELSPAEELRFSGTDLKDYYYCFRVGRKRSLRNALRLPLLPSQVQHLHAFQEHMHEAAILYPCLSTMAMGDNNAVEIGQKAHMQLGLKSKLFHPHELLTIHGRAPRGDMACGVVIDDVLFCEKVDASSVPGLPTEGVKRLDALCEEYIQKGLLPHPKKTFKGQCSATIWGAELNGKSGICRPAARRLVPLLQLTMRVARLGYASVALLEVLCGCWVSILQFRRRMMCLLRELYKCQQGRERTDVIALAAPLIDELWVLSFMAPLAATNLRACSHDEIFLSDASESSTASVKCKVTAAFAKELHRHCLARGTWSRLLAPWHSWMREHGKLLAEDELPEGVPLVSHPIWTKLAQHLAFILWQRKRVRSRRHINLLEIEAILDVERKLAERGSSLRYLLGADSQVALAALTKGRSSSDRINDLLESSLATCLGHDLYGSYGYVPSLANCADDPTRNRPLRSPEPNAPEWLVEALLGNFDLFDEWLSRLGYDPQQLAGLPFANAFCTDAEVVNDEVIKPLRAVAKSERLKLFDSVQNQSSVAVVESFVGNESEKINKRAEQESDDQTKKEQKSPKRTDGTDVRAAGNSVASKEVAPPPKTVTSLPQRDSGEKLLESGECSTLPELSSEARALLQEFAPSQFFLPGGRRAKHRCEFQRKGFLDLFSGKAGVAKSLSRRFGVWVLTFDFDRGEEQNLLNPELRQKILAMMRADCFAGVGAAPECASFSRAVTPAVRTALQPEGIDHMTKNMQVKVAVGNSHATFILEVLLLAESLELAWWCENPDGSFLWLLRGFVEAGFGHWTRSFRFDQCRYHTRWRKRTRIATNTALQGLRELCQGGHSHQHLRGRCAALKSSWTHVAQTYPQNLCYDLATALAERVGLLSPSCKVLKLKIGACAHCGEGRIGEASNPGPGRAASYQRDAADLLNTRLVEDQTYRLQNRVWLRFQAWLSQHLQPETREQLFLCPEVGVLFLKRYGLHLYSTGGKLYELRHLLVLVQQEFPKLRAEIAPCWQLVTKWEIAQPLKHRQPLPENLFKAMFAIAMLWRWSRWAASLLLGYEGIARVGEILAATRGDLVLPSDAFDDAVSVAFLKIRKPKSRKRGIGRIQHIRVSTEPAVKFLERHFGHLDAGVKLFPRSAAAFRSRWDRILDVLKIPWNCRPTPAGIRGGGAILAYKRNRPIQDILWAMRLTSINTLESYLQETAADSLLVRLPEDSKRKIRHAASFFPIALNS